ncbi:MAG: hypothetical protein CFE21_08270 [Bacteroidetes bacterium B1(2017)]|nr:MAG: hypothetical protein CFE21_08270 [Bacteroidetes bacterium B1(2017)]
MENTPTQVLASEENLSEVNVDEISARTKKGFSLIGFGALVLLAGCIVTMLMPSSNFLYEVILYVPTSVGACMVIYGMYCVME